VNFSAIILNLKQIKKLKDWKETIVLLDVWVLTVILADSLIPSRELSSLCPLLPFRSWIWTLVGGYSSCFFFNDICIILRPYVFAVQDYFVWWVKSRTLIKVWSFLFSLFPYKIIIIYMGFYALSYILNVIVLLLLNSDSPMSKRNTMFLVVHCLVLTNP
jgi:hypothetical protein